jgi:hypothetical protein
MLRPGTRSQPEPIQKNLSTFESRVDSSKVNCNRKELYGKYDKAYKEFYGKA